MGIGDDVALGVDNHARAQRTLAQVLSIAALASLTALAALSAEEAVEEVLDGLSSLAVVIRTSRRGTAAVRCGFLMVDSVLMLTTEGSSWRAICENWLDSLLRRRDLQRRRVRRRSGLLLALHSRRDHRANQNAQRSVARITKVEAKRLAFIFSPKPMPANPFYSSNN